MVNNPWSPEVTKARIIKAIEKAGIKNVKIALFKSSSEYNDNTYDYYPILVLISNDDKEIEHNINVYDFVPSENQQYEMNIRDYVENVTIYFKNNN